MKKLADIIVDKRYFILIVFLCITGFCIFLSTKVNINYDITKYLPKDSETRVGMDIMNNQFEEEKSSNLLVMFNDITSHEEEILNELKKIEGVKSVEYDESSDYNKDDYTLYNLKVDDYAKSETAKNVYNSVLEKYKDQVELSGSINEENKPVLETWIIITAICSAMIILIIICESYVEPFLFLFTIGLAVFINKGTNVMFSSVSNITDSICAILQMALSMDYSIMLMNRYTQEKANTRDNKEAMKNALHNSFASISSSSVTTIVGLMALVFMSFTIGKDLGYVLAKGVLLSLICIFAVLPCLILMCDNLITKTKKKRINIRMDKMGIMSHNFRYGALILVIILFVISYALKGNLGILYTDVENDKVATIFEENNQMAVVYNNKDEDKIAQICRKINGNKVNNVMCYGNTINEKLTYKGLQNKLDDLDVDVEIDDYLLKLVYYNYYASNKHTRMTAQELVSFIENEIYPNKELNKHIDNNIRNNIEKLKYFIIPSEVNKLRTTTELANIMGINKESIDNLVLIYHSNKTNTKLTINEFVKYVYSDVLANPLFAPYINDEILNSLNTLNQFIDTNNIYTKYDSNTMASIFGMDSNSMSKLYLYYYSINGVDTTLTINEFTSFILNYVINNPEYSAMFNEETINNIVLLNTFSNKEITDKSMNSFELSNLLGISEDKIQLLQILKQLEKQNQSTYTLEELNNIPKESLNELIIQFYNAKIINDEDIEYIKNLFNYFRDYNLNNEVNSEYMNTITPGISEYLNLDNNRIYTINEIIEIAKIRLQEEYNKQAKILINLIEMYNNNTELTYNDLANILEVNPNYLNIIYTLIDYKIKGLTTTPTEIIKYLINNKNNPLINNYLNEDIIKKIEIANKIIDYSIIPLNYNTLASITGINEEQVKNIYILHDSFLNNLLLDKKQLVEFLVTQKNDLALSQIDQNTFNKIQILNNVLDGIINNKTYSNSEMSNLLGIDNSNMRLIYSNYDIKHGYSENISLKTLSDFILADVLTNPRFASNMDQSNTSKVRSINLVMNNTLTNTKYTSMNLYNTLTPLSDTKLNYNLFDLTYLYYGSINNYSDKYKLTIEEFINYLNKDIIKDERFTDFIDKQMRNKIVDSSDKINDAKKLLIGKDYSRIVINTKYGKEDKDTMSFIKNLKKELSTSKNENYLIGDSPMAYDLGQTFSKEFNFISILTMIFIFIVVAITFKSLIIPLILTLIIQCAVYITMGILTLVGEDVYFIALLIVQSILMGATIDYAIVFTSYYIESRGTYNKKGALIKAYNQSIHTIITSASVLIIVTFIVGFFASAIAAKICMTISKGTLCSTLLILFILPGVLASLDKLIIKKH